MTRHASGKESPSEEERAPRRQNRRQALALGGAAAAAAAVAALRMEAPGKARAASGDELVLGQDNEQDSGDNTRLGGAVDLGGVFEVGNRAPVGSAIAILGRSFDPDAGLGPGAGVVGESGAGVGVSGQVFSDSDSAIGVAGRSNTAGPPGPGDGEGSGIGVWGKSGSGPGVEGHSETGPGVAGHGKGGPGVHGDSQTGPGVEGHTEQGAAVLGMCEANDGYGVVGAAPFGIGVHGKSDTGAGINGVCGAGPGVVGEAPGDHPGVRAESRSRTEPYELDGGVALEVVGKARFSTAGAGMVPQGQNSAFVSDESVTSESHVTVTLADDPGPRQVHWVQRHPGTGFTLHLTPAPPPRRPETSFTYLVVEPMGP